MDDRLEHALACVNDGWSELVTSLHEQLVEYDPNYKLFQCKEKFGGLRYYAHNSEDVSEQNAKWFNGTIRTYEKCSELICEICGKKGKLRNDLGWILTLCEEHYQEQLQSIKEYNEKWKTQS